MNSPVKISKILVIDDDPVITKLLDAVLKANGYEVEVAHEAPGGLESAMKKAPDLIILDVMMPIINGFNICRLLKSHEKHKNTPIILLTSRAGEDDKKIGHDAGADAYIAKPLDTKILLDKIKQLAAQIG